MVVGEASNGAEAMTPAQALHPKVVLVDLSTSTTEGITATAATCCLVVSTFPFSLTASLETVFCFPHSIDTKAAIRHIAAER